MSNRYDNVIKAELLNSWKETVQAVRNGERAATSAMVSLKRWVEEHNLTHLFVTPKSELPEVKQQQLMALLGVAAEIYGWDMSTKRGMDAAYQFKSRVKRLIENGEMAIAWESKARRAAAKKRGEPKAKQMARLISQALAKLSKSRAKGVKEARDLLNKAIDISK